MAGPTAMFFVGSQAVRYDILNNRVVARTPISEVFPGLPRRFTERIDAATVRRIGAVESRGDEVPPPGTVFVQATWFLISGPQYAVYQMNWDVTITTDFPNPPNLEVRLRRDLADTRPESCRGSFSLFLYSSWCVGDIGSDFPSSHYTAAYMDFWTYSDRGSMYVLGWNTYARLNGSVSRFDDSNQTTSGYTGFPPDGFESIDAAFVDQWSYTDPVKLESDFSEFEYRVNEYVVEANVQIYMFSGDKYARYDLSENRFVSVDDIAVGFPGVRPSN